MKPAKPIDSLIHTIRGQKVLIDVDLAELYGVSTKRLNEAVKRNADRFPVDFRFQLTIVELADLRAQSVISSTGVATANHASSPVNQQTPQLSLASSFPSRLRFESCHDRARSRTR